MLRTTCLLGLACLAAACGSSEPAPAHPTTEPPSATALAAPAASSAVPAEAEAPKKRRPLEITSACSDVVTVLFAEDPKAPNAGRRTIAPSASIEGPRDAEGNQTVWLLDPAGEPLVKVHVTRGMKRVEIGRSCRTIDAR